MLYCIVLFRQLYAFFYPWILQQQIDRKEVKKNFWYKYPPFLLFELNDPIL